MTPGASPTSPQHTRAAAPSSGVRTLRRARVWHRWLGLGVALLLLVSAVTGLLLGWKKQSDWLQPGTERGTEGMLADWRPLPELEAAAVAAFRQNAPPAADPEIDRMDIRPQKSVVKVRFVYDDIEVQVDGPTAAVLHVGRRNADWIERIHDGSFVSEGFKLVSMNTLGLGVVVLIVTGTWLYWGPKRQRRLRRRAGA